MLVVIDKWTIYFESTEKKLFYTLKSSRHLGIAYNDFRVVVDKIDDLMS